jgi:hypothetical protein
MRYILMQGSDDPSIEFYYVTDDTLQNVIQVIDKECNVIIPGVTHHTKEVDVKPPCADPQP